MADSGFDDGSHLVRVRAQVMLRDDSTGGWVPLGGGGLSHVAVRKRKLSQVEDCGCEHEYLILGRRISDQTLVLTCTIKKDFEYNKVMPTFHHWKTGNKKYGLTFQTAADARAFDKGITEAVEDLLEGVGGNSPLHQQINTDVGEEEVVFMQLDLPMERDSPTSSGGGGEAGVGGCGSSTNSTPSHAKACHPLSQHGRRSGLTSPQPQDSSALPPLPCGCDPPPLSSGDVRSGPGSHCGSSPPLPPQPLSSSPLPQLSADQTLNCTNNSGIGSHSISSGRQRSHPPPPRRGGGTTPQPPMGNPPPVGDNIYEWLQTTHKVLGCPPPFCPAGDQLTCSSTSCPHHSHSHPSSSPSVYCYNHHHSHHHYSHSVHSDTHSDKYLGYQQLESDPDRCLCGPGAAKYCYAGGGDSLSEGYVKFDIREGEPTYHYPHLEPLTKVLPKSKRKEGDPIGTSLDREGYDSDLLEDSRDDDLEECSGGELGSLKRRLVRLDDNLAMSVAAANSAPGGSRAVEPAKKSDKSSSKGGGARSLLGGGSNTGGVGGAGSGGKKHKKGGAGGPGTAGGHVARAPQERCAHCQELYTEKENKRGTCRYSPDRVKQAIDCVSCLACAKCLLYHCHYEDENFSEEEICSCTDTDGHMGKRWLGLSLLAVLVPCLCLYPMLTACYSCGRACHACGGKHVPV